MKPCKVLFVLGMIYWNVNALLLALAIWGPGVYYNGEVPSWINSPRELTIDILCLTKVCLTVINIALFVNGWVVEYRKKGY